MVLLVYLVKYRNVDPKNRVRFPKVPKTGKITVVVYPPWTREVVGSNPTSQTNAGMAELAYAADLGSVF